jgi:hypothetical protein
VTALTRAQTIALARTFLGVHESPSGSNRQMFGEWYGFNGVSWCLINQSYVQYHAGHPITIANSKGGSYCPDGEAWSKQHGTWHSASWTGAQPGDLIWYHFGHNHSPDHVGMVIGRLSDGRWHTIEGNTGSAWGGSVQERYRRSGIVGFTHLSYPEPAAWHWPPFPGETLNVGDHGKAVSDMKLLLVLSGVAPELSRQTPEQFSTFGAVTTALAVMRFKHLWNLLNGFERGDKLWLDPTNSAVGPTTWSCLVLSAAKHSGLH